MSDGTAPSIGSRESQPKHRPGRLTLLPGSVSDIPNLGWEEVSKDGKGWGKL